MGFLDILALEDFYRPSPLNNRQKRYIKRNYYNNLRNPEFFVDVCQMSDSKCELFPDRYYQILLKKMIYSEIEKFDAAFVS